MTVPPYYWYGSYCIYDRTEYHPCLSQNRQLFCSAFVHERVIIFATEIGPRFILTESPVLSASTRLHSCRLEPNELKTPTA